MIRRVLEDPGVWALAALGFAVWCMAQAFAGEPGLPSDSLPPPVYSVSAPVVAGAISDGPLVSFVALPLAPLERVAPATSLAPDWGAP